jgi:hypothetical protein
MTLRRGLASGKYNYLPGNLAGTPPNTTLITWMHHVGLPEFQFCPAVVVGQRRCATPFGAVIRFMLVL